MPRIMVGCKSIGKGYSSSTYSGERLVEPCESIRQALEAPASIPADSGNALLPNVHGPAELRELPAFGPVRPREQKSQIGRTQTLPTTCSASSPPRSGPATFANIVSNNLDCATSELLWVWVWAAGPLNKCGDLSNLRAGGGKKPDLSSI